MPDSMIQLLKRIRYVNTVRSFWSPEADVMVALVDQGDYVLDIGAYAGWYTRVLSEAVAGAGAVTVTRPPPHAFTRITTARLSTGYTGHYPAGAELNALVASQPVPLHVECAGDSRSTARMYSSPKVYADRADRGKSEGARVSVWLAMKVPRPSPRGRPLRELLLPD
jgi:hypothetical protein